MSINYTPPPSLVPFLTSTAFISLGVGPYGSGKTTAMIIKLAYMAKRVAPCRDGIRRSRAAWIRNTAQQLDDTSIPDFLQWYPDGEAGIFMKTGKKFLMKFDDVELEILFRGLDDTSDVRRLLSLQLTFGIMDEFREINSEIFKALLGRVGRYPGPMLVPHRPEWGITERGDPVQGCVTDVGTSAAGVWGVTNPPDADTYWEEFLTNPPENAHVTFQPSAMAPEADWVQYLRAGYYEDLIKANTEDWVDVYVHNKFGKSLAGRPVFRCFDRATHVSQVPLTFNPYSVNPLIVGFDCTGLNPAAAIGQVGFEGRLYLFEAVYGRDMGALRFIREVLKPLIANKYSGAKCIVVIDPAGMARQADEKNVKDLLVAEGFQCVPARTNGIAARIAAVEAYLTRSVAGKPYFLINPHCIDAIVGFQSKYRFKLNTKGDAGDTPDKNHPHSDILDACFPVGTLVATPDGYRAIETFAAGDYVTTPLGSQRVLWAGAIRAETGVTAYTFSDGTQLIATPDHRVYCENRGGFVPLDTLQYSDILVSISSSQERAVWLKTRNSLSTAGDSADLMETTTFGTSALYRRLEDAMSLRTGMSGKSIMALFQKAWWYTIGIMIQAIIQSRISKYNTKGSMRASTWRNGGLQGKNSGREAQPTQPQPAGTGLLKGGNGTGSTVRMPGWDGKKQPWYAHTAVVRIWDIVRSLKKGSARRRAKEWPGKNRELMTHRAPVLFAAPASFATDIQKLRHVVHLVGKQPLQRPVAVYTLQVEHEPMYFAAGILVKNCQYMCMHADGGSIFGGQLTNKRRDVGRVSAGGWT